MARAHFHALYACLRREPGELEGRLGVRPPAGKWLVACLAEMLNEHAGLHAPMPSGNSGM